MLKDLNLEKFPAKAGVYWFVNNNEVIYVGSSYNLKKRMANHHYCIVAGNNNNRKQDLYKFLKEKEFTVEYELTEDYREVEGKKIFELKPRFNKQKFMGIDTDDYNEYHRLYLQKNKEYNEEHKQYCREWNKANKAWFNNYYARPCLYKGEKLTFQQVCYQLKKIGEEHPTTEAKKYLIKEEV